MEWFYHLPAFFLPILIFTYWFFLGYASLSILNSKRNTLQNMLLAPTLGIAITLLPIFWLNRAGFPIIKIGLPITCILFIASIFILVKNKPLFVIKRYLPFIFVLFFSLLFTGYPLLKFGFDWISFGNDDMANYCLGAKFFLNHGYQQNPHIVALREGSDYSDRLWFFYSPPNVVRSGSELMLAWLSASTFIDIPKIFMSLIMAFYLSLISIVGTLVYENKQTRNKTLVVLILLGLSALNSLGVVTQLIAQVAGLSFLIACVFLYLKPFREYRKNNFLKRSILLSLVTTPLAIIYPELSSIAAFSFLLYALMLFLSREKINWYFIKSIVLTIFFVLVALNTYTMNVIFFLLEQIQKGMNVQNSDIFPYFLMPTGIGNLWNLASFAEFYSDAGTIFIFSFGVILSLLVIYFSVKLALKKNPSAVVTLVMILLGISLVVSQSGFGLFKIAMYSQPFILLILVIGLWKWSNNAKKKELLAGLMLAVLAFFSLITQHVYVKNSEGGLKAPMAELSNASKTHLLTEIQHLANNIPQGSTVYIDSPHLVINKLLAYYLTGKKVTFCSKNYFNFFINKKFRHEKFSPKSEIIKKSLAERYYSTKKFEQLVNLLKAPERWADFNLQNPPFLNNEFEQANCSNQNAYLIASNNINELINQNYVESSDNFNLYKLNKLKNYLIFKSSDLGQYYYGAAMDKVSFSKTESDYFYPNKPMLAVGRFLLFNVVNPSPKVRVVINLTASLNSDGKNKLPLITLIGKERQFLNPIGQGSARLISEPLNLQNINGAPYFMLDLSSNFITFTPKFGLVLTKLLGDKLQLDHRKLVGFLRNITLISENDYQNFPAPTHITHFPQDLNNAYLEYSGMYEDGWISNEAYFVLNKSNPNANFLIKGTFPKLGPHSLIIWADGKKILDKTINTTDFEYYLPIEVKSGKRKIQLKISPSVVLSEADTRHVGAYINYLGFVHE